MDDLGADLGGFGGLGGGFGGFGSGFGGFRGDFGGFGGAFAIHFARNELRLQSISDVARPVLTGPALTTNCATRATFAEFAEFVNFAECLRIPSGRIPARFAVVSRNLLNLQISPKCVKFRKICETHRSLQHLRNSPKFAKSIS